MQIIESCVLCCHIPRLAPMCDTTIINDLVNSKEEQIQVLHQSLFAYLIAVSVLMQSMSHQSPSQSYTVRVLNNMSVNYEMWPTEADFASLLPMRWAQTELSIRSRLRHKCNVYRALRSSKITNEVTFFENVQKSCLFCFFEKVRDTCRRKNIEHGIRANFVHNSGPLKQDYFSYEFVGMNHVRQSATFERNELRINIYVSIRRCPCNCITYPEGYLVVAYRLLWRLCD